MNLNPPELNYAASVAALLAQAGVQLAIAELGTGGAVAATLRTTTAAPCITAAHVLPDVTSLTAVLRVSASKMAAFGAVSAMVAAEAAAALIDTYEGGWGLAVLCRGGNHTGEDGVPSITPGNPGCFIALGAPSETEVISCAPEEVVQVALALLKRAAETRLAAKRPF